MSFLQMSRVLGRSGRVHPTSVAFVCCWSVAQMSPRPVGGKYAMTKPIWLENKALPLDSWWHMLHTFASLNYKILSFGTRPFMMSPKGLIPLPS